MTRGPVQAGNRASKTGRYLQWWDHGPECDAVISAECKVHIYSSISSLRAKYSGQRRWACKCAGRRSMFLSRVVVADTEHATENMPSSQTLRAAGDNKRVHLRLHGNIMEQDC